MHVLYVHPNFPAQFGHIAAQLIERHGWQVTFATSTNGPDVAGIHRLAYTPAGGATEGNHFASRTFENTIWNCDAVYQALKARGDIKPGLIVGHSGFGSTLFLRELYGNTPIVNFFEFYYSAGGPGSDLGFRKDLDWPIPDAHRHRARSRNAMILLDLQNCDAGYVPTEFQKSRFPAEYQPKLNVIFDGVDRSIYHGHQEKFRRPIGNRPARVIQGRHVGPSTRVVTYVSRGFETMRGFDIFMRAAQSIVDQFPDVMFFVVGSDRICYGGDEAYLGGEKSFKNWVLSRGKYDLSKFNFTGLLPPGQLAELLATTDLHIYLTAPFVLSWSLMNAMSCGALVLGSRTPPVEEMIRDNENGILADFFDGDEIADKAVKVLKKPDDFRALGRSAEKMIDEHYSLDVVLPKMVAFYEAVISSVNTGSTADRR